MSSMQPVPGTRRTYCNPSHPKTTTGMVASQKYLSRDVSRHHMSIMISVYEKDHKAFGTEYKSTSGILVRNNAKVCRNAASQPAKPISAKKSTNTGGL